TGPTGPTGPAGPLDVFSFAASWRIQWNAGSPIVTVKDLAVPDGIYVGLQPLTSRAECQLYVLGDSPLSQGALAASIGVPTLATQNEILAIMLQGYSNGSWIVAVDPAGVTGPTPAQVAAAVPPLPAVVAGDLILAATVRARYQSAGTTNNTAALLEDVSMSFSGTVS
ncbi:MAG: hypothetical protein WBV06_03490, partial [Acidimicrobiia bacterium]